VLGNPVDIGTQALILSAAEAVTIAERTRADLLAGKTVLNDVVRAEGVANRALRRLGLNKAAAAKPAGPSLKDIAERYASAVAPATSEARG
jgi:cytochrome c551/c552